MYKYESIEPSDVTETDIIICPYCRYEGRLVWVHGHGQCANCKVNIDECCKGGG